ncbi:reverse transcriptase domain-containing protein [Tanacetum coccineum]|uniref:Reverse transcriptase domain-containing protein n=1 Tax=Tanacetum coccineum TaxID=301880 RepID=A0ABQ5BWR6_9ASTR
MDDPNITMEEYIRLEEEKARRRGQDFNWEIATYGTILRLPRYPFSYLTRRLTMEEMLAKFIDEVKRVATRKGKMTFEATPTKESNKTGINMNEPPKFEQDVQEKPHDVGVKYKSSSVPERSIQPFLKSRFNDDETWYADFANYIVGKVVPPNWTFERRKRFFSQVKTYFWEEPYAFKLCVDNIIRRCVGGSEILEILGHCHSGPTGGHHGARITANKVYESGFYWPSVFKDASEYVRRCDVCQRSGNISSRNEMPQNNIQVEAQALPTNDARVVIKNLKRLFVAEIRAPLSHLISDRGTNFCNSQLEKDLQTYGVTHKISTSYHPQTMDKLKSPTELLNIFWKDRSNITPDIGQRNSTMHYGHLGRPTKHRQAELRDNAYENTRIYKERTKKWHDSRLCGDKDFKVGDQVLLYNSRLKMYPGKLKSKWSGPNFVKTVYPYAAIEIINENGYQYDVSWGMDTAYQLPVQFQDLKGKEIDNIGEYLRSGNLAQ